MIKLETQKITAAIAKAKTLRPRVSLINPAERIYSVTGSKGDSYTVKFAVVGGLKLAECSCKAGQANRVCYHLAAAAQANIMAQSMRQASSAPAAPLTSMSLASAPAAPLPVRPSRIVRRIECTHTGRKIVAVYCDGWAI
jgi:hypothetical protein